MYAFGRFRCLCRAFTELGRASPKSPLKPHALESRSELSFGLPGLHSGLLGGLLMVSRPSLIALSVSGLALLVSACNGGTATGAAGGAVTGAVVGGPVGAAVGGVAGAAVGSATTGGPRPVVVEPVQPCASRTTTTTNNNTGATRTTQTTDCPD